MPSCFSPSRVLSVLLFVFWGFDDPLDSVEFLCKCDANADAVFTSPPALLFTKLLCSPASYSMLHVRLAKGGERGDTLWCVHSSNAAKITMSLSGEPLALLSDVEIDATVLKPRIVGWSATSLAPRSTLGLLGTCDGQTSESRRPRTF